MIIDSIELFRVRMPLIYPFRTAFDNTTHIESVLVKLVSGNYSGWGETTPFDSPMYCPEWAGGVFAILRDFLVPRILGRDIESGDQLQAELEFVKGNQFAKAGLDLAWWDLYSRSLKLPLWKVLGGQNDLITVGADFGIMENIDKLLETISGAVKAGFKRIKLKYRPGWELDMIEKVRNSFPDTVFHIDCNSAYSLANLEMFKKLDRYNLAMIEQPLAYDDLVDHARLQKMINTAICLDESVTSPAKALHAIELGSCRYINIKLGRVGGITNAVKIHNLCQQAGIPVWVGGMLESAVGNAHNTALATLPNVKYPSDIFPSDRFYYKDLSEPETVLDGPSLIRATSNPGIGCKPYPEQLREYLVETAVMSNS